MYTALPRPGPEAQHHPPSLTLAELYTPRYYRPFIGLIAWPPLPYEEYANALTAPNIGVCDRRPGNAERPGVLIDGPCEGGYVSIDVNMMTMTPTEAAPGQYHRPSRLSNEWTYYADPSEAPKPRTNYSYYKSVVDFGPSNCGQVWNLMTAIRGSCTPEHDNRPGILILAKKDYRFSIPPGWHPHDLKWTDACESSLIVKIKDYKIPKNGRLEFRDMVMDLPGDAPPKRSHSFDVFTCNGDGIYPVEIIKDDQGVVTCVKVHFQSSDMELPPDDDVDIFSSFRGPDATAAASDLLFLALLNSVMTRTEGMDISDGSRGGGGRSSGGGGGSVSAKRESANSSSNNGGTRGDRGRGGDGSGVTGGSPSASGAASSGTGSPVRL